MVLKRFRQEREAQGNPPVVVLNNVAIEAHQKSGEML
jgi:hypothetical protein